MNKWGGRLTKASSIAIYPCGFSIFQCAVPVDLSWRAGPFSVFPFPGGE